MNLLDCKFVIAGPDFNITVVGTPLSDVGLDKAYWLFGDGRREKIEGVAIWPGEKLMDALAKACPAGAAYIEIDGCVYRALAH